ncbi:hypothetical protein NQ314_005412 [Rhamnusium bicolor]|uniref:Uncharacterized protein n=1 Tax=Rhamnusium bicolor TaxID=1586634 RepID=A0AAV8ZH49_9CUCU|nr:hypothetical protein NQ314_005412 [Rhamnusium bicolor]
MYWRELLMPYHGVDRNFNITSLVTVSVNYPLPVIKNVVQQILTPRRIIQLRYNPLRSEEIYEVFVSGMLEPITDKEYKKFVKWYSKTPLGKERVAFNKFADIKREAEARQREKAEANKKK